jgi:hypothetical protein
LLAEIETMTAAKRDGAGRGDLAGSWGMGATA